MVDRAGMPAHNRTTSKRRTSRVDANLLGPEHQAARFATDQHKGAHTQENPTPRVDIVTKEGTYDGWLDLWNTLQISFVGSHGPSFTGSNGRSGGSGCYFILGCDFKRSESESLHKVSMWDFVQIPSVSMVLGSITESFGNNLKQVISTSEEGVFVSCENGVTVVNLGNWLAIEGWMKPSLFDAIPNNDLLVRRFGNSPTLGGIELMNEPLAPGVSLESLKSYYKADYNTMHKYSPSAYAILANRLGDRDPNELLSFTQNLHGIVIDVHYYNQYEPKFNSFNAQQNINYICNQRASSP
ncbi:unnamed protein product [Prunus armeniaca]